MQVNRIHDHAKPTDPSTVINILIEIKKLKPTYKEQIEVLKRLKMSPDVARDIVAIKSLSKKGWETLGVDKSRGKFFDELAKR